MRKGQALWSVCPFLYGARVVMPEKNIILVGFMGAGKSTVSAELVRCGNYHLLDLDADIERRSGLTIQEIFRQQGESVFRDLESAALSALRGQKGLVVATGGGILGRPENRELIRSIGRVVYLRTTFSTLQKRLKLSSGRPLIKEQPDWHALEALLSSRTPFYETADLIIDTNNKKPEEIATEILLRLAEA
jgi:shikimate kinase